MKRYPAQDLEPAERDPVKLRRTAFILVGIMLLGAVLVLVAYNRNAANQADNDRPAMISRLNGNFKLWRQDESEAALLDLEGKVIVIVPVVFSQNDWQATAGVLKDLQKRYGAQGEVTIVMLTLDPENEPPKVLAEQARELGAELPSWWLATAREESVHKFVKNRLKANLYPFLREGKWVYDPALVVIDRNRHIRKPTIRMRKPNGRLLNERLPVDFDFVHAAELDAQGVPAGYDWDEQGNKTPIEAGNVETMKNLLFETIDQLLAEERGNKQ
jgi:cytochrome oxidase Cu insertion factor (SCO1/SenC/PrrC family)